MIKTNKAGEPLRLPNVKTAPAASKGGKPPTPGASNPNPPKPSATVADPVRTAPKAPPTATPSGAASSKSQSKPKAAGPSGPAKSTARRDAHIGYATVAPLGRERGGGGFGGSRHERSDIQDWMPFSAQQSRIMRRPRDYPAVGLIKVMAHPVHPFKAVLYSMASQFYSEVLPSLFRRTPAEMERNDHEIRKDVLRKEQKRNSERNEARREGIRKRAETDPGRVMAGDLTNVFATK